jgi:hypothetical protein
MAWIIIWLAIVGLFLIIFLSKKNSSTKVIIEDPTDKDKSIEVKPEDLADILFKSKLMCLKCKISYPMQNLNLNKKTTIFMPCIPPQQRASDGLDIRVLICFKCGNVTSYASDPYNHSGKNIDYVEYFTKYKLKKDFKDYIVKEEIKFNENIQGQDKKLHRAKIEKIKKIKV